MKKPDPHIYQIACEKLHLPAQACLYIGDGESKKLTGASQVGMHAVLLHQSLEEADTHRFEAEIWSGPAISYLWEVLSFLS